MGRSEFYPYRPRQTLTPQRVAVKPPDLVTHRSGMRWSRDGGEHVLDRRTYLKSGRWNFMRDVLTRVG